jgi:gas vesicle protein
VGKTAAELRTEIEQKRIDLSRDVDVIEDRIRPGRIVSRKSATVRQSMHRAKEAIMGTAEDATTTVQDHASSVRDSVGSATGEVGHKVEHLAEGAGEAISTATEKIGEAPAVVREQTQGNPLAVGLIAFGAGLLAATLIPASSKEQEMLQQVQPRLEDSARKIAETGQAVMHDLRDDLEPQVREAVASVKESAAASAEQMAEQAKQGAQEVKETATQGAS